MLTDAFGRTIDYLRISLTELCDFRCVYCVPAEGLPPLKPRSELLTRAEIARFVTLAGTLGITRIRLTGGEPLLREDILDIVKELKKIKSVEDLSITTNGSRLTQLVRPLKEAGLDRLNISLDSLIAARFEEVTRSRAYRSVIEAVYLALEEGFPVKLNAVAMKGLEEDEIVQFLRMAYYHPFEVRFLEFMPLCGSAWGADLVIKIDDIRRIAEKHFTLDEEPHRTGRVAQVFRIRGGKGKVGFIGSLSESFCNDCSRIRLTADGRIRPCLFSDCEVSVGALLKGNAPDEKIIESIRLAAAVKPKGNNFLEKPFNAEEYAGLSFAENPMIRRIGG